MATLLLRPLGSEHDLGSGVWTPCFEDSAILLALCQMCPLISTRLFNAKSNLLY